MGQNLGVPMVEIEASISILRDNVLDLDDTFAHVIDATADAVGRNIELQLVSVETDQRTLLGKRSHKADVEGWVSMHTSVVAADEGEKLYRATFKVPKDFGVPGAILVESHHPFHFFLSSITLHLPLAISQNVRELHFPCNSWVYNHHLYHGHAPRVFFTNQVYLPNHTPDGLVDLRYSELEQLRGDGTGKRWRHDRIYDYDVYNDLGDPDKDNQLYSRTILGASKEFPYPRRCRTGRDRTEIDPSSERPVELLELVYVPRDERFQRIKKSDFLGSSIKSFAHGTLTVLERLIEGKKTFTHIDEVKELYSKGVGIDVAAIVPLSNEEIKKGFKNVFELAREIIDPSTGDTHFLKFPVPQVIQANHTAWLQDDEFARQMLAGLNPMVIERLKAFPIESKLDPNEYGPTTSSITSYNLEKNMNGLSIAEAINQNRLYILDYHDVFLPYIGKINALEQVKAYASRTVFFLTENGTLKLLAIELSLPCSSKTDDPQKLNRVFTPPHDPNENHTWWHLAKAHVSINDAGYHQLISHWLRTHASIEPFIIATHRHLSVMHPLHVLLVPHFKNTMNINAIARKILINAYTGQFLIGGIIERTFFSNKYSMEMSSVVYRSWRFDEQGLPADLLKRGMAVEDPTSKYGLRLLIEDYPFAVDGLEIWWAIKEWVRDYLSIFYKGNGEEALKKDVELERWWNEVLGVGHGDKKEGWINVMQGVDELGEALTTIIWLASAHHAAVNFGQYAYAGFMPNKPTSARKLIPFDEEDNVIDNEKNGYTLGEHHPHFLTSLSTKTQAIIVMAILEILSTHADDEEYLGDRAPFWIANEAAIEAFKRFKARLSIIEKNILVRNDDPKLHNRHGSVKVPYTLLSPFSSEGLTGKGIPNSTSI